MSLELYGCCRAAGKCDNARMAEREVDRLFASPSMAVLQVRCAGTCRHRSAEECSSVTHLVFPYRGVYVRHVGGQQTIADANQVLFFNATEGYQVSHPVEGGDDSLVVRLSEDLLRELAPAAMLTSVAALRFKRQHLGVDAEVQSLVVLLRHRLANQTLDALAAETLPITLVSRSLGRRSPREARATPARRRLVDRVKLLLLSDLSKRWKLAEIGAELGSSPVYLTQLFQQIEGVPLYRYHLRLRLARALQQLPHHENLAALALELGFSSHAHFTSSFRRVYGRTPSEYRRAAAS
jgi:AraC family transcriptional regulator